ncbi:hypothetical protein CAPN004_05910 [Capnocytophaga cynodegmi]|uniref:phospholipase D-like domain-containing protein n=1 Tax=Capnocytophaga cynodegmi TaxID=28189 RepID=UPI001AD371F6|nr:phospholipase D-like domain-containing protein [Capnocytophaga cynodegmi]GIM51561.1 hypothetical protein CAPN004_05910 [Capnocytophaga cynodegmi]
MITQNIENHILSELNKAEISIDIAVAWITSERLIHKIDEKRKQGVRIRILCWKDENSKKLKERFSFLKKDTFEIYGIERMHRKYCIIDKSIVIHGSYNWTEAAKGNEEYIEILKSIETIKEFQKEFDKLYDTTIRRFENSAFKNQVIRETKEDISSIFEQKIGFYIDELAKKNKDVLNQVDTRINLQKETIQSFEKRTKLYKKIIFVAIVFMLLSILIVVITMRSAIVWYKESTLTRQEVREELLNEFNEQNLKLYKVDDYKKLEEYNQLVQDWISKNPKDSRKFIEYKKLQEKKSKN